LEFFCWSRVRGRRIDGRWCFVRAGGRGRRGTEAWAGGFNVYFFCSRVQLARAPGPLQGGLAEGQGGRIGRECRLSTGLSPGLLRRATAASRTCVWGLVWVWVYQWSMGGRECECGWWERVAAACPPCKDWRAGGRGGSGMVHGVLGCFTYTLILPLLTMD